MDGLEVRWRDSSDEPLRGLNPHGDVDVRQVRRERQGGGN